MRCSRARPSCLAAPAVMPALHGVSQLKHNCQGNFLHRQNEPGAKQPKGKDTKGASGFAQSLMCVHFGLLMELCVEMFWQWQTFLAASQPHCAYHQVVKRTKIAPLVNLSKACGICTDLYSVVVQSNVHIALEVIARARR